MKKTILLALGAIMSLNAWSYTDVAASIKWADGTANAVVTSDAADGIKEIQLTPVRRWLPSIPLPANPVRTRVL